MLIYVNHKYKKPEPASALADAGSANQRLFLQPLLPCNKGFSNIS